MLLRAMKVAQEIKGKIRMGIAKLSHLPLILQELNGGETDLMKKETDPLIVIVDEMEKIFVMSDQFRCGLSDQSHSTSLNCCVRYPGAVQSPSTLSLLLSQTDTRLTDDAFIKNRATKKN